MKTFIEEFKAFAVKGNVIDLAVAVVIGAAFGKIVESLVNDIIMPTIGFLVGKVDFSAFTPGGIKLGIFANNVVNFLIIALSIFIVIKWMNRFMPKKPAGVVEVVDKPKA